MDPESSAQLPALRRRHNPQAEAVPGTAQDRAEFWEINRKEVMAEDGEEAVGEEEVGSGEGAAEEEVEVEVGLAGAAMARWVDSADRRAGEKRIPSLVERRRIATRQMRSLRAIRIRASILTRMKIFPLRPADKTCRRQFPRLRNRDCR